MQMPVQNSEKPRTIGIAGTGVIGSGWAVRALSRGYDVMAWDPAPDAAQHLANSIRSAWPAATRLGLFAGADPDRVSFSKSAEELAERADWIQENAPEDINIKRSLLKTLAEHSDPSTIIASSSSGLLPSALQDGCAHPERIVIGHPFNPVYLLPLVEVVAGKQTSPATVEAAVDYYDDLVMYPLVVRNEIEGYLSDRLQEAMWREVLHLVNDGVATTAELDDAIVYGPGLRWSAMGTNLTFHLAGGLGGMRHMLAQFGPDAPWARFDGPEHSAELISKMAAGCEEQAAGRPVRELEQLRDDSLISLMRSLRPLNIGAGKLMARREARIHSTVDRVWSPQQVVPVPLNFYAARVEPDWVDYNGHMTEAAFLTAFGWASDKLFRYIGIDEDYRAAGGSLYTVETHINYLGELRLAEPLRVATHVLGVDTKRVHIHHFMYHGLTDELLCTTEQMLLHVDTNAGKVSPIPKGPAAALEAVADAHAAIHRPVGLSMAIPCSGFGQA